MNLPQFPGHCKDWLTIKAMDGSVVKGNFYTRMSVIPRVNVDFKMARQSQIEHFGFSGLFSEQPTTADTLIVDITSDLSVGHRVAKGHKPASPCGHTEFFARRSIDVAGKHSTW